MEGEVGGWDMGGKRGGEKEAKKEEEEREHLVSPLTLPVLCCERNFKKAEE